MSMLEEVFARRDEGRLVLAELLLPGSHERAIYLTTELLSEIESGASVSENSEAYRIGQLMRDFDRFSRGGLITVGYGRDDKCMMKPLDPIDNEVWEIRSRDPKPALRVFGRFAMPDVFIATHKAWRYDLGKWRSPEWKIEIRRTKSIWKQMFPSYIPHSGKLANDYITKNVVTVGDLP